ncbi:MAG: DUF5666 domain-containing protein [Acidimicrobiales bacterium]
MNRAPRVTIIRRVGVSTAVALGTLAAGSATGVAGATSAASPPSLTPGPLTAGSDPTPALASEGVVTDRDGGSVTVRDPRGSSRTFALDASTVIRRDGAAVDAILLRPGQRVAVVATARRAATVVILPPGAAGAIEVEPALVAGTVVAVAGGTVTVADHLGFYRPVRISPAARLTSAGTPAALADVRVGASVVATGFVDATHTALEAATIDLDPLTDDE